MNPLRRAILKAMGMSAVPLALGTAVSANAQSSTGVPPDEYRAVDPQALAGLNVWFRNYSAPSIALAGDVLHIKRFRKWFREGVVLDGREYEIPYTPSMHYQIAVTNPRVTSNVYYIDDAKLLTRICLRTGNRTSEAEEIIQSLAGGENRVHHGALHWRRHQNGNAKVGDNGWEVEISEVYYLVVHLRFRNGFIAPALKISFGSTGAYHIDTHFASLDNLRWEVELGGGRGFQNSDTVEVTWHELASIFGFGEGNVFYAAARLEAQGLAHTLLYKHVPLFAVDGTPLEPEPGNIALSEIYPSTEWLSGLLNFAHQHPASPLVRPTMAGASLAFGPEGVYFKWDGASTTKFTGTIDTPELPVEAGPSFNKFLEFVDTWYSGQALYVGQGRFLIKTEPSDSLVAQTGERSSAAGELTAIIKSAETAGTAGAGVSTGVAIGLAIDEAGDAWRNSRRTSPGNQQRLADLNAVGDACGLAPAGGAPPTMAECEACVANSNTFSGFADTHRSEAAGQEVLEIVGGAAAGCVAVAVAAGVLTFFCGGCLGVGIGAMCIAGAVGGLGATLVTMVPDAMENEAYIQQGYNDAVARCANLN